MQQALAYEIRQGVFSRVVLKATYMHLNQFNELSQRVREMKIKRQYMKRITEPCLT